MAQSNARASSGEQSQPQGDPADTRITQINSRSLLPSMRNAIERYLAHRREQGLPAIHDILEIGPGVGVSLSAIRGMFPNAEIDMINLEPIDGNTRFVGVQNIFKEMYWAGALAPGASDVSYREALEHLEGRGQVRQDLNLRQQYVGDFFDDDASGGPAIGGYDLIYEQYGPTEKSRSFQTHEIDFKRLETALTRITPLLRSGGAFIYVCNPEQYAFTKSLLDGPDFATSYLAAAKERHCAIIQSR